ncbi:hypothetical protein [Sphingobacterium gobiense]|uniref:Uncharacterized protein n=1 Tax=Sphingobacterium gobiense TaxID=1382456 RepID=A0A2S9JM94_9SPHI|nr:hypothetical protein [Sphingobacterium gobiense]PRD54226.1 hypothetical protein C5749_12165 [Sphingobacterium gobiense]
MRKILLSILFLWTGTVAFGQSISWSFLSSYPHIPITYVDDTKLTYESANGVLKVEYELVTANGENILYYDIQLSPLPGDPITELEYYGFSEGSIYHPIFYTSFWNSVDGSPLSGSVTLNQGDPEDFCLYIEAITSSNIRYHLGFFATYYPY